MRFVVFGAGAVGGVVGGRLFEHGHEVVLIARGRHLEIMRDVGLTLEAPDRTAVLPVPCAAAAADVDFRADDVVLLAVKSQHTADALNALIAVVPRDTPVVCLQNGVANERAALRHFANVYGVTVVCPTAQLDPGVVRAYSTPIAGLLDIGRYPAGIDDTARSVAAAFERSTFSSVACDDIVRWKWAKLLSNLGNAIEAVCGPPARRGPIGELVRDEARLCLQAAGIDHATADEERRRLGDLLHMASIGGAPRPGGSSWQSLARSTGTIETDFLNGEIVLLGRMYGIATPANALLQELATEMARRGRPPGAMSPEEFLARCRGLRTSH